MTRRWRTWRPCFLLGVGMLALVGCDPAPRDDATSAPTSTAAAAGAAAGCAPTRGEAAQAGTPREVAADAPSKARLGPGGEVRRTAETVAKGRGGQRLVVSGTVYRADCKTPLAGASIAGFAPSSPEAASDDLPTILRLVAALTSGAAAAGAA